MVGPIPKKNLEGWAGPGRCIKELTAKVYVCNQCPLHHWLPGTCWAYWAGFRNGLELLECHVLGDFDGNNDEMPIFRPIHWSWTASPPFRHDLRLVVSRFALELFAEPHHDAWSAEPASNCTAAESGDGGYPLPRIADLLSILPFLLRPWVGTSARHRWLPSVVRVGKYW